MIPLDLTLLYLALNKWGKVNQINKRSKGKQTPGIEWQILCCPTVYRKLFQLIHTINGKLVNSPKRSFLWGEKHNKVHFLECKPILFSNLCSWKGSFFWIKLSNILALKEYLPTFHSKPISLGKYIYTEIEQINHIWLC